MTPHSYSLDAQTKSTDLAGKLLTATTPTAISAAISAVDTHLTHHSADQNRHFFSLTFPTLISKLFGFTDDTHLISTSSIKPPPPSSWIDTASYDSELANILYNFLSPNGTLISSIFAVDKLSLVKYVFPNERLPEWIRFMLNSAKDCRILNDLCPLFKGRVKEDEIIKGNCKFQVHLNVFEYFMFWFSYYPVCRANNENLGIVSARNSRKFRLENWTSSIAALSTGNKRNLEQKSEYNLYLRLLYVYLREFVPMDDLNVHQPYRSSLLHYSGGSFDDSGFILRAEFLVNLFVHYWLVDNDLSPLAVNLCKSFGVAFPFRSALGETPPASGLGEVVRLFVKYLNLSSVLLLGRDKGNEFRGGSGQRKLGLGEYVKTNQEVASWNAYIQRPLYRFILRTFLFCPMGSSMKNISEVFSVWVDYIEPWKLTKEEFGELEKGIAKDSGQLTQVQYSLMWEGFVLSNYLFYTSLVMHFIGFAHKFLHTDAELIVRMVSKVLDTLTSSRELLDLIKNVDIAFHSKHAGSSKSAPSSFNKFVPQIREQLQDWEDGLSESDADGSFLHENWNRDLRLFSDGEDGGLQLLQLFILRAETELQAIAGDNLTNNLQCLHSLKSQLRCLFGEHVVSQAPLSPRTMLCIQASEELFRPRRLLNGSVANVKYKGDWLRRPISDDEVAWLAKVLIQLSIWLNESLGLNRGVSQNNGTPSYVEVPTDTMNEYGASDSLKVVIRSIVSFFYTLRLAIARVMIRRGLKVNLRVLASKKVVTLVLVFALFSLLRRAFRSIW